MACCARALPTCPTAAQDRIRHHSGHPSAISGTTGAAAATTAAAAAGAAEAAFALLRRPVLETLGNGAL
eukprot:359793-Chlamydomonas_euryale.AAC.12